MALAVDRKPKRRFNLAVTIMAAFAFVAQPMYGIVSHHVRANAASPCSRLCINEVSSGSSNDWVELYNGGDSGLGLSFITVSDGAGNVAYTGSSRVLMPGQLYVVDMNNYLDNAGDKVEVLWDGHTYDTVSYGDQFTAGDEGVATAPTETQSFGRATDGGSVWKTFVTPTKDKTNVQPSLSLSVTPNNGTFSQASDITSQAVVVKAQQGSADLDYLDSTVSQTLYDAMKAELAANNNGDNSGLNSRNSHVCANSATPYDCRYAPNSKTVTENAGLTITYAFDSAAKVGTWTFKLSNSLAQRLADAHKDFGFDIKAVSTAGQESSAVSRNFTYVPAKPTGVYFVQNDKKLQCGAVTNSRASLTMYMDEPSVSVPQYWTTVSYNGDGGHYTGGPNPRITASGYSMKGFIDHLGDYGDGEYKYKIEPRSVEGQSNGSGPAAYCALTYDHTGPKLTLNDESRVSTSTNTNKRLGNGPHNPLTFAGTVTDNGGVGAAWVDVTLKDNSGHIIAHHKDNSVSSGKWNVTFSENTLAAYDGKLITAIISTKDTLGNQDPHKGVMNRYFIVDTTAPIAKIASPTKELVHGEIAINGSVSSDTDHYFLIIKDESGNTKARTDVNGSRAGVVKGNVVKTWNFDTNSLRDGVYKIWLSVKDKTGNKDATPSEDGDTSVAVKKITIDNTSSNNENGDNNTDGTDDNTGEPIDGNPDDDVTTGVEENPNNNSSGNGEGSLETQEQLALRITTPDDSDSSSSRSRSSQRSFFSTLFTGDNSSPVVDGSDDSDSSVKGAETDKSDLGEVEGASTSKGDQDSDDEVGDACTTFLGLCWYYWIPIVIVIAVLIWLIARGGSKEDK